MAPATRRTSTRVDSIRQQIEETTSDYDKEKLQERVAKLSRLRFSDSTFFSPRMVSRFISRCKFTSE
jgi:hypothetical protein